MNLFTTPIAHAAGENVPTILKQYVGKIVTLIVNPAIYLIFTLALIYFLYGVTEMFLSGKPDDRKKGKQYILWGLIGMTIMVGVFTIMRIIGGTVGNSNPI